MRWRRPTVREEIINAERQRRLGQRMLLGRQETILIGLQRVSIGIVEQASQGDLGRRRIVA